MQVPFSMANAVETAPCQARAKQEGCAADAKTRAGVGRFRKYCKDAFDVAGPVHKAFPSADFLRQVAFWSIRLSEWLRWPHFV